jgi:hypothetical protein
MKKSIIFSFIVLVCLIMMPAVTYALPISGAGVNGGSFTGTIDIGYSSISDSVFTAAPWLIISLTNTSSRDIGLYIAGYVLPNSAMSEIDLVRVGDTWSGRLPLTDGNREISVDRYINGFVVYFSDARGVLLDKAPVAVSEPSTMLLLGFGLLVIGVGLRKKTQ